MKVFDTLRTIRVPFLVVISLKGPSMSLLNNFSHQIYGQIYFLWLEISTDQILYAEKLCTKKVSLS